MTFKLKLHTQIFIGIALGILFGLFLKDMGPVLEPIGEIFVRLLKMIIVPLVLASIVMGVVSLGDIRHVGKIGFKTFVLFISTTLIAVCIGEALASAVKPGVNSGISFGQQVDTHLQDTPSIGEIFVEIVPNNIFGAMAETNLLSIIFFAVLIGLGITVAGERGKPLLQVFDGLNQVMMKVTEWIMALTPIGVFALLAGMVAKTGLSAFIPLLAYMGTVLAALFIHGFIVMPILLYVFAQYPVTKLIKHMLSMLGTSFSTASSSATLPVTMDSAIKNVKVSNRVASFVLPLGSTINMDGTAIVQGIATVFLAQASGVALGPYEMVLIAVTATLASIGAAGIPSAGIVTLAMMLDAVGVPIEGISIILTVDRVLDMCRTSINVWGDVVVAVIVAKLEGETFT